MPNLLTCTFINLAEAFILREVKNKQKGTINMQWPQFKVELKFSSATRPRLTTGQFQDYIYTQAFPLKVNLHISMTWFWSGRITKNSNLISSNIRDSPLRSCWGGCECQWLENSLLLKFFLTVTTKWWLSPPISPSWPTPSLRLLLDTGEGLDTYPQ